MRRYCRAAVEAVALSRSVLALRAARAAGLGGAVPEMTGAAVVGSVGLVARPPPPRWPGDGGPPGWEGCLPGPLTFAEGRRGWAAAPSRAPARRVGAAYSDSGRRCGRPGVGVVGVALGLVGMGRRGAAL